MTVSCQSRDFEWVLALLLAFCLFFHLSRQEPCEGQEAREGQEACEGKGLCGSSERIAERVPELVVFHIFMCNAQEAVVRQILDSLKDNFKDSSPWGILAAAVHVREERLFGWVTHGRGPLCKGTTPCTWRPTWSERKVYF